MKAMEASRWLVACSLLAASSLATAAEPGNGLIFNAEPARVVDEGGLGRNFTLAEGAALNAPGFPGQFANDGVDACVAIGYRVRPDGSTGEYVLLEGWNSAAGHKEPSDGFWQAFSLAAVDAVAEWKFAPRDDAKLNRDTITMSTFAFRGSGERSNAAIRSRCDIGSLASHIQKIHTAATRNSILWASIQDRGDQPQRNGPHWMTPRSQLDMPSDWVPGRPYRPSAAPAMTTTSFSSSSAKPAPALSGKGG